jgi:hypothetical protein
LGFPAGFRVGTPAGFPRGGHLFFGVRGGFRGNPGKKSWIQFQSSGRSEAPSFWNRLRGLPRSQFFVSLRLNFRGRRDVHFGHCVRRRVRRPLCSSMRPHRTVLTSRQRYQRKALKYFSIEYPEIEISAEGRILLSMPTPPPSPPPGFHPRTLGSVLADS